MRKERPVAGKGQAGLQGRAIDGILWMLSGTGARAILRLVLLLVLARLLGPEVFGIVGAALVVVNLSEVVCQFGIGGALIQRAELEARHVRAAFTSALVFAALITGGLQLLAPAIAGFFAFDGLTSVLLALSVIPLLGNLGLVAEALSRRSLAFRRLALIEVVSFALGYGLIGIGLAVLGAGVWALVAACLTETATRSLALLAIQPHAKSPSFDLDALKAIWTVGGGLTGRKLANALAQGLDNIVVGRWLGAEALGLYGRAYQLTSIPAAVLGRSLDVVLLPVMSRVQDQQTRLAGAYRRSAAVLALLSLPAAAAVVVLAPELVAFLLGPAWHGAVVPLQILAPGIFLRLSFQVPDAIAAATGAVYPSAWRQGLYAAAVLVGAVTGQHWGLPGVAAGVLAAQTLHFVVTAQLGLRLTSLRPRDFAGAHRHGVLLGALVAAELVLVAAPLRDLGAPPASILGVAAGVLAATALVVIRLRGGVLIGADGVWLLRQLTGRLPRRLVSLRALLGLREPAAAEARW